MFRAVSVALMLMAPCSSVALALSSSSVILQVLLDDMAALDAYQQDPYHCGVVKKHMHAVAENSIAMDYTVE